MEKTFTVPASLQNLAAVASFVEGELQQHNCSGKIITKINIAVDEIASNIIKYAYVDLSGDIMVAVDVNEDEKIIRLTFTDGGVKFNPLELKEPDVTLSAEERKIGGLGFFIVKKYMDEITYSYEDGKNILTLIKSYGEERQ